MAILQSVYYSNNILPEEAALLNQITKVVVTISTAYTVEDLSIHLRQFLIQHYYYFAQE